MLGIGVNAQQREGCVQPTWLRIPRWQRAIVVVVLVTAAAVAAVLLPVQDEPKRSERVAREAADVSARRACGLLERLLQQASGNAPGDQAVATARRAREAADRAARADPKWVQLSSAMQAIEESLTRDDPTLAATGARVGRAACTRQEPVDPSPAIS